MPLLGYVPIEDVVYVDYDEANYGIRHTPKRPRPVPYPAPETVPADTDGYPTNFGNGGGAREVVSTDLHKFTDFPWK
jgi:hypothetical protein